MKPRRILRTGYLATRAALGLATEKLQTGLVFNPLSGRHRSDPYPLYRRLRERDPILRP